MKMNEYYHFYLFGSKKPFKTVKEMAKTDNLLVVPFKIKKDDIMEDGEIKKDKRTKEYIEFIKELK